MQFFNWCNRVFVDVDTILKDDNDLVTFVFHNIVTGKETIKEKKFSLVNALKLAERRRDDGRYKNYEFYIY